MISIADIRIPNLLADTNSYRQRSPIPNSPPPSSKGNAFGPNPPEPARRQARECVTMTLRKKTQAVLCLE
jgi:hypothetical protein